MEAITSLGTNHGFSPFSQENTSKKSKLYPVMSLDLKEQQHPMASPDFTNHTLTTTAFSSSSSSSSVAPFQVKKTSSTGTSRGMRWWEKSTKHHMLEIHSANHLVDSLLNAGDRLVVLHFFSPACGGCKSLHPKVCQLAESNPDVIFLKVNQEELRTMCHGLNIHVLPFFKFYRGAEGKVCSFSCTIATISKFKKALEKHGSERCSSLGPAKGLDEKELAALASVGELKMNLNPFKHYQSSSSFGYKTEEQYEKVML
ncbi:PREDICTED: thioredoxin-like 1-2, chloroplastic [Camelina sativa]|uniref:Thioredoxin-like 1-2, chloroplastic n=1 Tax=Camelina sativa TaxID=90675 RepID=A0ABM0UP10_CAMSA|nr:PREDICTED: thioredoxin-like 1-2, chloroplastic [Camelina sativa]